MLRATSLTAFLFAVDFLDELVSGVPSIGAPDIRVSLALGYAALSTALMTAPMAVGLVLDPLLFAWARGRARAPLVAIGLAAMAVGCGLAALAPGAVTLAASLSLLYLGSGLACGLAQSALMDGDPERREACMTRWTLMGALGDTAAPLMFAALHAVGLGYRQAFLSCGGACAVYALALWRRNGGAGVESAEPEPTPPPLGGALRAALANRPLLAWTAGEMACLLLDEVLVAFAALHMREPLGFDTAAMGAVLLAFSIGAAAGLLLAERLLQRVAPLRLLASSCAACLLAYAAWLLSETPTSSAAWMFCVGLCVGPQYPIAKAQAYRAAPDDSLVVVLVGSLLQPINLALPLVVGLVADRLGLRAALLLLAAQPVLLLALAISARSGPGRSPRARRE